jgi:hypothetical protein
MTTIKLATYQPGALWASRVVAVLLGGVSFYIASIFQEEMSLFFVVMLIGVSASLLIALFVKAYIQQMLSRHSLRFAPESLIISSPTGDIDFALQQPYQLQLIKTEGDHKERGGSVLLSLVQGSKQATLLGALGKGELPPVCEALFASAREVSYAEIQREGQRALWLSKDGDMAQLLPIFVPQPQPKAE